MKKLGIVLCVVLMFVLVSEIAFAADKTKTKKKDKVSADGVYYNQGFEEEDDVDAWSTDVNELEWKKDGAKGSKGCLNFTTPQFEKKTGNGPENISAGYIECEKYIEFKDDNTVIEFDYFAHGIGESAYVRAYSNKTGFNVPIKDVVKEKWAHASVKVADMKSKGDNMGEGKTFRTHIYVFVGVDKSVKYPYVLIDNVSIKANKK